MKKSPIKLYLATLLLTLTLASAGFAGDTQCPIAPPPPPPPDEDLVVGVIGGVFGDNYISFSNFLKIIDRSVNIF